MELVNIIEALYKSLRFQIILFLVVVCWTNWLWKRRHLYRFALKFPGFWGLPIIGSGLPIIDTDKFLPYIGKWFKSTNRHTIGVWLGLKYNILTEDPEFAKKILTNIDMCNGADIVTVPMSDAVGRGIIVESTPEWQPLRRKILPCFHKKVVTGFVPIFDNGGKRLVEKLQDLENKNTEKLPKIICDTAAEVGIQAIMGQEPSKDNKLDERTNSYFDNIAWFINMAPEIMKLCNLQIFWLSKFNLKYGQRKKFVREYVNKILSGRGISTPMNIGTGNNNSDIFIDLGLRLYKEKKLTWSQLIWNSNNLMGASTETLASAIYSATVILAVHPIIQERLFDEISSLFPDSNVEITLEHLELLPYLDMFLHEVLRLFPPIPVSGRKCVNHTTIDNELILPKGTEVLVSAYHIHRRTEYWGPNAHKFNPDNFLPEKVATRHPYAYLPFSKGIRNCIGSRYAIIAMKIIIAHIIHKYSFSTDFKYDDLKLATRTILHFVEKPEIRLHRRKENDPDLKFH